MQKESFVEQSTRNHGVRYGSLTGPFLKAGCLLVALLLAGMLSTVFAQVITSSITGVVVDATQARIPGATVTLMNHQDGTLVREIKSNEQGFFRFSDLLLGTYDVKVEESGFDTFLKTGLVITSTDDVSLGNVILKAGSEATTIVVHAETVTVDTTTANNENSLSAADLSDVKVRSDDPMEAMTLLPGMTDNASGTRDAPSTTSVANIYTNGIRSNSKNIMIDGAASLDPGSGANVNAMPSSAMIAEMKVVASNYRADSGRNAGPTVTIVTKGGSSVIHGSFDFPFRNEFFNANSPDEINKGLPRPEYRLILPSYTLSGPILIPHVIGSSSRLFFMVAQQYQYQKQDVGPKSSTMPTTAELQGNFAQSIGKNYAPITVNYCYQIGQPAGYSSCSKQTTIPTSLISPEGQAILSLFPLQAPGACCGPGSIAQNLTGAINASNYTYDGYGTVNRSVSMFRVDWNPTPTFQTYARVLYSPETDVAPYNGSYGLGSSGSGYGFSNMSMFKGNFKNVRVGWGFLGSATNTFSSSLLNTLSVSVATTRVQGSAEDPSLITTAGTGISLPSLYSGNNPNGWLPTITTGAGNRSGGPEFALDSSFPAQEHLHTLSITDNLTKVKGVHALAVGVYTEAVRRNYWANGANSGGVNVQGAYSFAEDSQNVCDTGDTFANVLVGCIDSYTQTQNRPKAYLRFKNLEFYGQDEWRATPRLTLSMGVRLYHDPPAHDALNQFSIFVPSLWNQNTAPYLYMPGCTGTAYCTSSVATVSGSTINTNIREAYDPRTLTPVAYAYKGLIVPGSGNALDGILKAGSNGLPRSVFTSPFLSYGPRFGFNYSLTPDGRTVLKGGFGIYYDRYPLQNQLNLLSNPPTTNAGSMNYLDSYTVLSSVTGMQTPPTLYTMPTGKHQPPTNHAFSLEIQRAVGRNGMIDVAYVGSVSQHMIASRFINPEPMYSQLSTLNPQNVDISQSKTGCGGTVCMLASNFLVPYRGYSNITMQFLEDDSNYNALQIAFSKQYANGHIRINGNYTFGKALGDAYGDWARIATYTNEPLNFRGPLNAIDRRNIINGWYVVSLPDLRRYTHSRFLSITLREWNASGIVRYSSGAPFNPSLTIDTVPSNGGITGSTDAARPVVVNPHAKLTGGDVNGRFGAPAYGTWGNMGIDSLNFPSWINFDTSLYREFRTSRKVTTRFMAESYNTPNSSIINSVNTELEYAKPGATSNEYSYFDTPQGTGNYFRRGRVIQFDLSARW